MPAGANARLKGAMPHTRTSPDMRRNGAHARRTVSGGYPFIVGAAPTVLRASAKSHPAMRVRGLGELRAALERDGVEIADDTQLDGHQRWYVTDPFGNRIELIEEVPA